jgi:hypothetical protein
VFNETLRRRGLIRAAKSRGNKPMGKTIKTIVMVAFCASLTACIDNDLERAAAGAVIGGGAAAATGNDVATGVVIGGAAGVFCDDVGVCN